MRHLPRAGELAARHHHLPPEGGSFLRRDQLAPDQAQVGQLSCTGHHHVVRQRERQGLNARRRVGVRHPRVALVWSPWWWRSRPQNCGFSLAPVFDSRLLCVKVSLNTHHLQGVRGICLT